MPLNPPRLTHSAIVELECLASIELVNALPDGCSHHMLSEQHYLWDSHGSLSLTAHGRERLADLRAVAAHDQAPDNSGS